MPERIQKLLSRAGVSSRRRAEVLIRAGRVRVNGRVARLGDKADPGKDTITVDGQTIELKEPIYVKLHKPKGVLSSLVDELGRGRPTLLDIVDVTGYVYPAGRLDKQSEGLMLLTSDGSLAHRLTHPRYGRSKLYRVAVAGPISSETVERWRNGVLLDGLRTAPAEVDIISQHGEFSWLEVRLREGRKRQIRRVAALLGHPVTRLVRVQIGPIKLGDLASGEWRYLTKQEIVALRRYVRLPDNRPVR